MHSDTFYGDSFFDIAIWCQLTKNINTPSLTVIPGSHLPKGGRYQEREINEEVGVFGDDSKGKGIGVPYRPVSLSYRQEETQDLIIPYGSVCIFFGSLLHKSAIHTSPQPRISFDFRLTPLLLPSTLRKNKANYFTPLYINKVTKSILDCYAQPIQDLL
jgi:ectoine hydroxylase-related dioxygenase (phytanoyl-CoA dioxygenase family)